MLKKVIFSFLVLIFLSFLLINKTYGKENEYIFSLDDEVTYNDDYKKVEVVNNEISILIKENDFLVKINNEIIYIFDKYTSYFYTGNELYIVSKNTLYLVNIKLLSYTTLKLNIECYDLLVNEYIYLVGSSQNKPVILVLNKDKKLEKVKIYESNDNLDGGIFTNIILKDDMLFLIGIKDAYFNNDIFLNVGNRLDKKSFILLVDKSLKEKNIYHFNENNKFEEVVSYSISNTIDVILKSSACSYYYSFDNNLNLIDYLLIDNSYRKVSLVRTNKDKLFLVSEEDSNSLLLLLDDELVEIFAFDKELINYNVIDGGICFTIKEEFLKTYKYSEYHILKQEELILNRISYNLDDNSHFLVESFFEKLEFQIDNITPFYQDMISGEYQINYVSINKFGRNIYISTPLKVLDYVNIINGGIYNKNTKLMFFGRAYLNGNLINNGYTLKEEGKYELVIKNINGNELVYKFTVVDNYYKDNDSIQIPYDYIINKNEELEIELEVLRNKKTKEIIINSETTNNFNQIDNKLYVYFSSDIAGYKEVKIEKIIFEDNEELIIDKKYILLTRKNKPCFNIEIRNSSNYEFNIEIDDPDLSIIDLVFKNDVETHTYLKEGTFNINSSTCYIKYELGDGVIYEHELFKYIGDNISTLLEIDDDNNICLSLKTNKGSKEIIVNNENIYKKEKGDKNFIIFLVTIISSLIISILIIVILIIRKSKTNKLIKLK